jgi:hypothetical protein
MRRSFPRLAAVTAALAAVAALTGFTPTATIGTTGASFRTPDGATACSALADGAVACRTRDADRALVLHPDGRTARADGAVEWTRRTRVLLPAQSWWYGPISCRGDGGRVTCSSGGEQIGVGRTRSTGSS